MNHILVKVGQLKTDETTETAKQIGESEIVRKPKIHKTGWNTVRKYLFCIRICTTSTRFASMYYLQNALQLRVAQLKSCYVYSVAFFLTWLFIRLIRTYLCIPRGREEESPFFIILFDDDVEYLHWIHFQISFFHS